MSSTTEEFYVETKNDSNEMEERIIVISKTELTEADVITGMNMLTLQLKYLIKVEQVTKLESGWSMHYYSFLF